jgi:NADP-dependent 3-hydroxy acid dehydrogenase YdfG
MKLKNKIAIITGASQGLGEALAYKIAEEGGTVALVARTEKLLQKVKTNIIKKGGNAEYFVCDIRNEDAIKDTISSIMKKFGTADLLINNAGIWTTNRLEKKHPEKIRQAFETNVLAHITFINTLLPIFKKKNSGYIFNIISTSGASDLDDGGSKDWQAYGATKWAMRGFTNALRNSLKNTKIKVTSFFPGGMNTNIFSNAGETYDNNQPWMMKREDVADIIVFALTRPDDVLMERIVVTKIM